jgi:outer membrane protein assembly factor BamB
VVSKGIVYMSTNDGQLYAFDVATGSTVTGFPVTTSSNNGAPAVDAVNKKVYVLAGSSLYARNLDGTSAWTAAVGAAGANYDVGPVVEAGFVYLKAGGNLQKYDSTGAQQWSVPSAGNDTQPAILGGFVYVNTESGQIRKYDKATGAEVTTGGFPITTPSSQAGLAAANGRIFHKADQLYAYDASTGATDWAKAAGGNSTYYDSPAVSSGVVYVYGWDSKLYAFNEATGATVAGFPSIDLATPSDRNYSSPTVAGDKVFVGAGTSQKLKVLGAAGTASAGVVLDERPTFSADSQGFDLCSPVVSDGFVFAMLDGGGLYAFSSGGGAGGGAISINGGAACTESQDVILTIDPGSNIEMRISEDPLFTGASFGPVATSKPFTLSAGFGTKTVYIQFKDSSGKLSNVFNDQIEYSASCGAGVPPAKATAPGKLAPAGHAASCVRRAISLTRADVSGDNVVLRGLVQPQYVGRKVTILANSAGATTALKRLTVVTANAAGQFKATVRRPKGRKAVINARYRAQVSHFRSISLKLPQSLSSRSVKQVGGQIEVRGKVKRSVLGKRNPVVIKRLVCGRYGTVGQAKPDSNGNYVARFSVPANVAVALFRAESLVLDKPGSRRYVKQYARARSITLTNQTG